MLRVYLFLIDFFFQYSLKDRLKVVLNHIHTAALALADK